MRHHRGMYSQGHPQVVTRAEPQNRCIQHGRAWQMSPPGCVRAEMHLNSHGFTILTSLYLYRQNRGQW